MCLKKVQSKDKCSRIWQKWGGAGQLGTTQESLGSQPQFPPRQRTGHGSATFPASLKPGPGFQAGLRSPPPPRSTAKWAVRPLWPRSGWWANEGAPDSRRDMTCLFSGNGTSGSRPGPSPRTTCPAAVLPAVCAWRITLLISLLSLWKDAVGAPEPPSFCWKNGPSRAFRCQQFEALTPVAVPGQNLLLSLGWAHK